MTLILLWIVDSSGADEVEDVATKITTGLVGLIAAALALGGVLTSIENQNLIAEKNRLQELAAWRSALPLALSRLTSISRSGMIAAVRGADSENWLQADLDLRLEVSSNIMETLRNCNKSADDDSRRWLAVLISRYQVYKSRSENLVSQVAANYDTALDWATFHALVEHCYPFARGAVAKIDDVMDSNRIRSAFFLANIEVDDDADFAKTVSTRLARYGLASVSIFEYREQN